MKLRISKLGDLCLMAVSALLLLLGGTRPLWAQTSGDQFDSWPFWGGNTSNTHSNSFEHTLTPEKVSRLEPKWIFTAGGDVSATPTVDAGSVYVPDWAGNLFKIDRRTGEKNWSHKISEYTGISGSLSRNSPAIVGNLLIFGDQASATVMAVDKRSGLLVWKTLLDSHAGAIVTGSALEFGGKIYLGVSSNQEFLAAADPKFVLSFIGSVASLDAQTGHIDWQTFMALACYTCNSAWGSNFSIDPKRQSLYIVTRNNYSGPATVYVCVSLAKHTGGNISYTVAPPPQVSVNEGSRAALDPETGNIIWKIPAPGLDATNPKLGAGAEGQVSAAAGFVYAGTLSGEMVAIDGDRG